MFLGGVGHLIYPEEFFIKAAHKHQHKHLSPHKEATRT